MQNESPAARVQANLQDLFKGKLAPGDAYVKFQLTSEITALLSMEQVQESSILEVGQITSLPGMPESIIGITSSHDRVFCVYDLAKLLNLSSSLVNPRQYQILVLDISKILKLETVLYMGLAVSELQGIIRFPRNKIQFSQAIEIDISSNFILGHIKEKQLLPILNTNIIIENLASKTNQ